MNRELLKHWHLDPEVTFLNHGSFGACPRSVLAFQDELRARMEREPVRFFMRDADPMFEAARAALGAFIGAHPDRLAFLPNATTGVNAVLRGLALDPGDELLVTNHEYNACRNVLDYVAGRSGACVVPVAIPFPIARPEQVHEAVLAAITPRTRLLLIDHVTSPTGLVQPIGSIVALMNARGIDTLVDGAHTAGMIPVDVEALGASWYTGNCHKWLCAPKGAAFLAVRSDRLSATRPLCISHGANAPICGRTRFRAEFDWMGTDDPTAALCVPEAIRVMATLVSGGWPEIMARNRALALEAQQTLCAALGCAPPAPPEMIGSMVTVVIRGGDSFTLHDTLFDEDRIEVPVSTWPQAPHRILRVSAQLYNDAADYARLAQVIQARGLSLSGP